MGKNRVCIRYKIVEAPVCVDWEIDPKTGKRRCKRKEIRKARRCAEYAPA